MAIRRGPAKGMKWIVGSSNHGCWLGTYELKKQQVLEPFVRPGMAVYDVGANAGFYTLFFSRLVGEAGKVYAFEPFGENVPYLLSHTCLNDLRNVEIVQLALSDKTSLSRFSVDRGRSQNALTDALNTPLLVPTITLDAVVEQCGFRPPDLIKMDVEGGEGKVLEGSLRTLKRHRPIVAVALHSEGQRDACVTLLEKANYQIISLDLEPISPGQKVDEICALPGEWSQPAVP